RRPELRLERRDAVGDPLVVDRGNGRRVGRGRKPRPKRPGSHASFPDRGGTTTSGADLGRAGTSHRKSPVAAAAPRSCATMKPGASAGRIPANVSEAARASVTAGLANEVEAVNQ